MAEETPLTTTEKFTALIEDLTSQLDLTKALVTKVKTLQKEVTKLSRGKKSPRKAAEVDPDAPKRPSALQKPVAISNELCKFLGFEANTEHSRQEVTAAVNKYIKDNELQDPENRRFIKLEGTPKGEALKSLLRNPDQPVTFFNIQRYLKPHYPMSEKEKKAAEAEGSAKPTVVVDAAKVEEAPEPPKAPVKKRAVRNPKSA